MRIRSVFLAAIVAVSVPAAILAGVASDRLREGESQLREGKIEEAVASLQQAVVADPRSSLAYTRLGGAQVLKQDYNAGLESFKQAIALDANNANAFVGMAVAYLHTARYSLARAALEEAKRIDPAKQEEVDRLIGWIEERASDGSH